MIEENERLITLKNMDVKIINELLANGMYHQNTKHYDQFFFFLSLYGRMVQ